MEKKIITLAVIIGILGILASQSLYTVHQTEMAIVLQLGEPVRDVPDPGLHFKLPFVQNVVFLDARILTYDATRASAYTSDNKNIVLDNFTRWRIKRRPGTDPLRDLIVPIAENTAAAEGEGVEQSTPPAKAVTAPERDEDGKLQAGSLKFFKTLRTVSRAQDRLGDIVNSELRVVIGRYTLTEVITTKRQAIMNEVITKANALSAEYGIEIVDVRLKRADLPEANQVAVFDRMRAERIRLATQYRSEGVEESTKIRSAAEVEQARFLAEARNEAQAIKGRGDAEAIRIFAEALSASPEFFEFTRSLEVYKKSLKDNTRILLPLDSDFLKYFN